MYREARAECSRPYTRSATVIVSRTGAHGNLIRQEPLNASRIITYHYGIDGLLRTREVFGWSLKRSNEWLLARASAAVLRSP
ncbi:MAG TPA: hypothetical protein VMA97_11530 [Streptosporangiaceae bacterium]|nr:hypothetical protein [Streptosporangiaceae bacterium]